MQRKTIGIFLIEVHRSTFLIEPIKIFLMAVWATL